MCQSLLVFCTRQLHCKRVSASSAGNSSIQRLDLGNKGLGAAGTQALQQAIVARGGLDTLILSGNQLGDAGAEALAPAVPLLREVG